MNLVKVSKETEKKEKPIIKAERNENNLRKLTDEDSYIIVHYGKDASYPNGFRTDAGSATLITKIMYNGNTFEYNSALTIIAGTYIEIYISSSQTTISSFFYAGTSSEYETNCANIKLIDLSHLKNSFRIMTNFFTNCNGIKALDMSMINLASVTSSSDFFKGITSLIYLNIYNTELGDNLKQTLKNYFNDDYGQNLIVCQSEEILTVTKFEYKCCDFLAGECEPESKIHIDIYFSGGVEYKQGFNIETDYNHRDTVVFLKLGSNKINLGESFSINSGDKLEIYFSSDVTTLESFFDHNYDYFTEGIVSIDFSNFNISGIVSLKNIFKGCNNLISVNFNNFKANSVLNMESMFSECSSLISIDLSGLNAQSVTTMESMFDMCNNLQSIILNNLNTASLTNMKLMFNKCERLVSLSLSNFNTAKVTTMESMLNECRGLPSIDLSSFNTALVTNMQSMFDNCNNLVSLSLSNFNTAKVTTMESMLNECYELISIDLSSFNTASVTNMKSMFNHCPGLVSLSLSSFNTAKVTTMESMFNGCRRLISLNLSIFNTNLVTNMDSMLKGCTNLKMLDISGFDISQITTGNEMFNNLENLKYIVLKDITLPSSASIKTQVLNNLDSTSNLIVCQNEKILTNNDLVFICCDFDTNINLCKSSNYIIAHYKEQVTYDRNFVNEKRSGINFMNYNGQTFTSNNQIVINANTEIELHILSNNIGLNSFFDSDKDSNVAKINSIDLSHLDSSSVVDMSRMFYGCSSLESINLNNFLTSAATNMSRMFYGCSTLVSINLNNFITSLVTDMSYMFDGCSALVSINLNTFSTSLVTDMDSMFNGCNSLNSIDLSNFDVSSVTNMNSMFSGCQSLGTINLLNFVTSNVVNMNSMFSGCNSLQSINLLNFNTSKVINMGGMFNGCNSLQSINLEQFDTSNVENMNSMFSGCDSLQSINLEQFDTSNVENMNSMFSGCDSLQSINLEQFDTSKVEDMSSMFKQCNSLKILNLSNFKTSNVNSMNNMFYGCSSLYTLDISNFNILSTANSAQMFNGMINIHYINLLNTKDNSHISESVLNDYNFTNKKFYICQQNKIITNPMSKNCCEFDNEGNCIISDDVFAINITETNHTEVNEFIYDTFLLYIEDLKYTVVKTGISIFQFSTIDEQLNNKTELVSSVDLGECEQKLREQEGLNDTEEFLMLKLDIKNTSKNGGVYVQYEIFNPHNFSKVSLDICKGDTIKIEVPVILEEKQLSLIKDLNESGYNIFDINDTFYNDICSTYTAQNGADMTLSSRKTIIYDSVKDMFLCQEGCEFQSFNTNSSSANCHCKVQTKETIFDSSQLSFDKKEFFDGFYTTLLNSNFRVVKCIKLLFSLKGMKSNYGFYFMALLMGLFFAFAAIHIVKGHGKITNIVIQIISLKEQKGTNDNNNIDINSEKIKEKKEQKIKENDNRKKEVIKDKKEDIKDDKIEEEKESAKEDKKEDKNEIEDKKEDQKEYKPFKVFRALRRNSKKKFSLNMFTYNKHIFNLDNLQAPIKKRNSIRNKTLRNPKKSKFNFSKKRLPNQDINIVINTGEELIKESDINQEKLETEKRDENKNDNKENEITEKYRDLKDEELMDLDYEEAIIADKRTYWQLYFSLIKKDQLILFTFFRKDDYNLPQIKILLFIVSFAFFFAVNGFFFTDETMDNIYEVNGAFDIIFQIPQILYSTIITSVISIILQKLSISEDQILEMKKEKDLVKSKEKANKILKNLKLKLTLFLVFSFIFMLFFAYFISCFCAVYENTQLILIQDTLISFGTSLLYPFGFKLLPGLFRIPALRAKNKNKKLLYKISKLVNLI